MIQQDLNAAGHTVSVAAFIGAAMGWLPAVAAGVTIVWYCIKIYETDTVQKLLGKKRGE